MLNLALVGLLAGSLVSPAPDGDKDKHRNQNAPAAEATAPVAVSPVPEVNLGLVPATDDDDPRVITADTYAFGRPVTEAPIKMWVHYAWGESESVFDLDGETLDIGGDIVVNMIGVGAHINFLNFPAFQFGAGAQLNVAQRKFQAGAEGGTDIESDFGLQGVKVYGSARGRVLGIHGGYIFDLGSEAEFDSTGGQFGGGGVQTRLANSDGRSASFFGLDFDYPSDRFRLFGGFDYFILEGADAGELDGDSTFPDGSNDGDNIFAWVMGAGLRFGAFELGAALMVQSQVKNGALNTTGTGVHLPIGSHLGTVAPYVRFSPTFFPASIFIKGGVNPEYVDRGYAIGGANYLKPSLGFTAGITVGFD